jgi:uncharacterized membrane protein YfcA
LSHIADQQNMEQELLVLSLAVFGASALQSATGIGFGVIAGPLLLVVLSDGSAIQISIVLNLVIAVSLAPSLRQKADRRLLGNLVIGLLIGSPLGLLIYLYMGIALLKGFAGFVVFFTLIAMLRNGSRAPASPEKKAAGKIEQIAIGVVAGTMGGSLAMPGPVPAAWMSARGFDKETIRATILLMFVFAYVFALVLQFALAGISMDSLKLCAVLAPSTLAGVLVGQFLSSRISEQTFRRILVITLVSTIVMLLSTLG